MLQYWLTFPITTSTWNPPLDCMTNKTLLAVPANWSMAFATVLAQLRIGMNWHEAPILRSFP